MKTLSVTSPLTRGLGVAEAQRKLHGDNAFHEHYLTGKVDGVFGQETGRACIRAKFWLGYPDAELLPVYGSQLDGLLDGANLPALYAQKREKRLEAAKHRPLGVKALTESLKHLGVKESPPDSNIVRFSKWYGATGPWCAMFVSWCYVQAGSKAFVKGHRYAYVPYIVNDARAGKNGLAVTHDPKPGDVVCYDWDGGVADHTGLFEKWIAGAEGSEFQAIEGNTSTSNNSNGGEVMRRNRSHSQVQAFVRVGR